MSGRGGRQLPPQAIPVFATLRSITRKHHSHHGNGYTELEMLSESVKVLVAGRIVGMFNEFCEYGLKSLCALFIQYSQLPSLNNLIRYAPDGHYNIPTNLQNVSVLNKKVYTCFQITTSNNLLLFFLAHFLIIIWYM